MGINHPQNGLQFWALILRMVLALILTSKTVGTGPIFEEKKDTNLRSEKWQQIVTIKIGWYFGALAKTMSFSGNEFTVY